MPACGQVVKSDSATVRMPELDFEIPPNTQRGSITTVEGLLRDAADALRALQPERRAAHPVQARPCPGARALCQIPSVNKKQQVRELRSRAMHALHVLLCYWLHANLTGRAVPVMRKCRHSISPALRCQRAPQQHVARLWIDTLSASHLAALCPVCAM